MDRSLSTLISPSEVARSRQTEGLKRLAARRGRWQRYEIDPSASTLTFAVSFLGFFTVRGTFSRLSGTIHFRNDSPQSSVAASVPVATVHSGIALRDRHLRSRDYLDAERFPMAHFESSAVEWQQDGYLVHGRLTIRDHTRAIVVHMSYPPPRADESAGAAATDAASADAAARDAAATEGRAIDAPATEGRASDASMTGAALDLRGHFALNRRHFGVLGTGERRRRFDPRDLSVGNMVDITITARALPIG